MKNKSTIVLILAIIASSSVYLENCNTRSICTFLSCMVIIAFVLMKGPKKAQTKLVTQRKPRLDLKYDVDQVIHVDWDGPNWVRISRILDNDTYCIVRVYLPEDADAFEDVPRIDNLYEGLTETELEAMILK